MAQFAPVDSCLSSVYPIGQNWVGKSTTGEVRMFETLSDYKQYLNNLASSGKVCPDVSVPFVPPKESVSQTLPSGFLEFIPRDQNAQARYSAMSPSWLGQEESQKALSGGKFSQEEVYVYKASDIKGASLPI